MTFDLVTNYQWNPPAYLCVQCSAFYVSTGLKRMDSLPLEKRWDSYTCRVCGTTVGPDDLPLRDLTYPSEDSLRGHLRALGAIAVKMPPARREKRLQFPPLAGVMEALAQSRRFVHFLTYSIDTTMLGALKMASEHTQVRGIIGTVNSYNRALLEQFQASPRNGADMDDPYLILAPTADNAIVESVHSKLLIVDGLIAFKGSANLTVTGLQKAGAKPPTEMLEVVSRPAEVLKLNNDHFAPLWLQNTPEVTAEDMLLPF